MDNSDGTVLIAAAPANSYSWLGLSFQLSVLPMLLVDRALEIAAANPAVEPTSADLTPRRRMTGVRRAGSPLRTLVMTRPRAQPGRPR